MGLDHSCFALRAPLPTQNREAVVFTQGHQNNAQTIVARLADGHQSLVADHQSAEGPPKVLAAATRASTVAWLDASGRVRAVPAPGQSPRLLGRTGFDALAVSPSGGEVVWLEANEIIVSELNSGRITRRPHAGTTGTLKWDGAL